MAKFTIEVTVTEGSNKFVETMEFDVDTEVRRVPNPRQALVSHFTYMAKKVLAEVDPAVVI